MHLFPSVSLLLLHSTLIFFHSTDATKIWSRLTSTSLDFWSFLWMMVSRTLLPLGPLILATASGNVQLNVSFPSTLTIQSSALSPASNAGDLGSGATTTI